MNVNLAKSSISAKGKEMQTIITNNHWRNFVDSYDVPEKVIAEQFDYLDLGHEDSGGTFFKYRGYWYHLSDFLVPSAGCSEEMRQWDGFAADSYFSGIAIKLSEDCEQYKVALILS